MIEVTNMPNSMDCKYLPLLFIYLFYYKTLKLQLRVYTYVTIQID